MITSTTPSDTKNTTTNNTVNLTSSNSVVQSVKRWFRNTWPLFGKKIEEEAEAGSASALETKEVDGSSNIIDDEITKNKNLGNDGIFETADVIDCDDRKDESFEFESNSISTLQEDERIVSSIAIGPAATRSRMKDIVAIAAAAAASPKQRIRRKNRPRRVQVQLKQLTVASTNATRTHNLGPLRSSTNDNDNEDEDENGEDVVTSIPQQSSLWNKEEIAALCSAYSQCKGPTSTTLWHDIASIVGNDRSASDCSRKWFDIVTTPKKKRVVAAAASSLRTRNGRETFSNNNNHHDDEDDDIFDSTPLRNAVEEIENSFSFHHRTTTTTITTTKQALLPNNNDEFHSPRKVMVASKITMKSPLHKKPRMFSPKNNNKILSLSPSINRRRGYNTYINNLRKDINRAQKAKQKKKNGKENSNVINRETSSAVAVGSNIVANQSCSVHIEEGGKKKGWKSQLSAELLVASNGKFVLNIPNEEEEEEESGEDGSCDDIFGDAVFCMEDDEESYPC